MDKDHLDVAEMDHCNLYGFNYHGMECIRGLEE